MTIQSRINIVASKRSAMIGMLAKMGCPDHERDDVIQEVLIKIYTRYLDKVYPDGGQINYLYIYFMLRSAWLDTKKNKIMVPVPEFFDSVQPMVENNQEWEEAFEKMASKVRVELSNLGAYASKLMLVKHGTGISLRNLADETGISVTSIYNSLKNYGQQIRENCSEDWEDFQNGDFDHL